MNTSKWHELRPNLWRWRSDATGAQGAANAYLLATAQGVVLVDPGVELQAQNSPLTPQWIVVTHTQSEHIAGALEFPDVPLYVPAGDEYLCAGRAAYEALITPWPAPWDWESRGNYQGHLAGARNERPAPTPLKLAGSVREDDDIAGLRALSTPGHGKHALSFIGEIGGQKIAFCGDLIFENGQLWNWFDCDWDYGLQSGQNAVLNSAKKLSQEHCDLLLPAHGEPIFHPTQALETLIARLERVLRVEPQSLAPLNFPDVDSPSPGGQGWRELLPALHQWRAGNCAVLRSRAGAALMVDDGLCDWNPEPARRIFHDAVMDGIKSALGISAIEVCIPTHYHGDHIESIPALVELEGAQVICLDTVAQVIARPQDFNLAAALPWYGTLHDTVKIDRSVPDGTKIGWREFELEIFHLGGQTWYHAGIAVDVAGVRVLFVGDALAGWNTAPDPVLCFNDCEPQTRGWAYAIDRMIERAPDLLVCGHGSALREPMPLLLAKRERWQTRLAEFAVLNPRGDNRWFFDPFLS